VRPALREPLGSFLIESVGRLIRFPVGFLLANSIGSILGFFVGAALLTLLSQGGDGTLRAYGVWLRTTLFGEQARYDASVASYLAITGADPTAYAVRR
jgi:hypothetical protein